MLGSLYVYRNFLKSFIVNDFRVRFARNKLGMLWGVLNPLAMVLIYTFVFSNVMKTKLSYVDYENAYSVYLMVGLMGWALFSEVFSRAVNIFIEYKDLIKKTKFPLILLPSVVVGVALINSVMFFTVFIVVSFLMGFNHSVYAPLAIPILLLLSLFSISAGMIVGIFNVFIRDLGQFFGVVLQLLFWFTPIVYTVNAIPEEWRYILGYNPIYPFIESLHSVLLYGEVPKINSFMIMFICTATLFSFCLLLFRRAKKDIRDEV